MKVLGIVGGVGPESTIEYYRAFFAEFRRVAPDRGAPRLLIDSVDVNRLIAWVTVGARQEMVEYLAASLGRLAAGGADFALISANTPHLVFDELRRKSPLPLLSIVEATCAEAKRTNVRRALLIGTRFTMSSGFYSAVFAREGVSLVTPNAVEQETIHGIYINELLQGIVRETSRSTLIELLQVIRQREAIDAVILGGTELPLILREARYGDVVVLDTTQIHVRAAVEMMLA